MSAMRVLMDSIVDYAGLFPPAKLGMSEATANYAKYRRSPEAWMLARFITPVAHLDEFATHAEALWSAEQDQDTGGGPWFVSALIGEDLDADIDRIFAFNQRFAPEFAPFEDGAPLHATSEQAAATDHPDETGAVIDTIELKAASGRDIDRALRIIPEQLEPYFEIDWRGDSRGIISALAGTGARAKVRTGGITPDQIPPSEVVAAFIAQCAAADVPFKATAGLHHAIRAEHALTYEPGCARGTMHGFINVFLAAAFIKSAGLSTEKATALLNETDASAFRFGESHAAWRGQEIGIARLAAVRERFAISFGSCSFDEPVEDVTRLGQP